MGKTEPQWVHELLGTVKEVPPEAVAAARAYEAAWDLYAARDFDGALAALDALRARAEDAAVDRLHALAMRYREQPPPAGWDGTTRMDHK